MSRELTPAGQRVEKLEEEYKIVDDKYNDLFYAMSLLERYFTENECDIDLKNEMINPSLSFIIAKLKKWNKKKTQLLNKISKIENAKKYNRYL